MNKANDIIELTHISLFTGIAGIDLAAEWAGFRTVLFVEIDPYCQKVLNKHWPGVPIIGDIKDVKGKEYTATLITGGFPCQPVSHAGKRRGTEDVRWLWPEMLRVIRLVRSTWVVAENVAGLLNMGFDDCISDLESEGYETISFIIPACSVNAPHQRYRIFIVAHSNGRGGSREKGFGSGDLRGIKGEEQNDNPNKTGEGLIVGDAKRDGYEVGHSETRREVRQSEQGRLCESERTSDVANSTGGRLQQCPPLGEEKSNASESSGQTGAGQWAVEPELGRVAYGIPNRVDRLKCLGNAVVPQQIYPILKAIADIERGQA